jgi:hypothetical protein
MRERTPRSRILLWAAVFAAGSIGLVRAAGPAGRDSQTAGGPDVRQLLAARWPPQRAAEYMARFGALKGCNYVPRFDYTVNQMWIDWNEPVVREELAWAREIGVNSVRVWVGGWLFQVDRDRLFQRFDRFLEICEKNGISVIPVTETKAVLDPDFDPSAPGSPKAPIVDFRPGVHLGHNPWKYPGVIGWKAKWPRVEAQVKEFVQAFLRRYAADKRIVCWDLSNEPRADARPLVEQMFAWAREVNPSQPLTASWAGEDLGDIWTFHTYMRPGGPMPNAIPYPDYHKDFEGELQAALSSGRPILCTEFMARQFGNTLDSVLPFFSRHRIGWYVWGLCVGAGQYHYPWNWPIGSPEPKEWFHCLLYPDGSPYRVEEVELIRSFAFTSPAAK